MQNSLDKEGEGHYILGYTVKGPLDRGPPPQIVPSSQKEGILCQRRKRLRRRGNSTSFLLFCPFSGPLQQAGLIFFSRHFSPRSFENNVSFRVLRCDPERPSPLGPPINLNVTNVVVPAQAGTHVAIPAGFPPSRE